MTFIATSYLVFIFLLTIGINIAGAAAKTGKTAVYACIGIIGNILAIAAILFLASH